MKAYRFTDLVQFIVAHSRRYLSRTLFSIRFWPRVAGRRLVPAHLTLGRKGEKMAADFLRRNGFRILYRNFRSRRGGEIDLVCRDRRAKTLVFVEVKTRTTDAFGPPHAGVTRAQQDRIIHGAKEWLRLLNDPRVPYRFDVVEVLIRPDPKVHLIRGAFQVPDDIYW
ncbi:MAG TPA: YraN family protein [Chthoniobacterales bacterium]|nr:YraN family protein [Chthoniobacterales bacterium]